MTDTKVTALTAITSASDDDILYIVDDPAGTPVSKKITKADLKKGTVAEYNTSLTDGDFATLAGSEALTNKTYNGNTITSGTGTITLGASSTLVTSATNSITLTSTAATNVTLPTSGTLGPTVVGLHDIFIPASAMWARTTTGAGGLTKNETATNRINYQTFDFDTTTSEFVQFSWIPPRNYNNGTIKFTPYWTAASGAGTKTILSKSIRL